MAEAEVVAIEVLAEMAETVLDVAVVTLIDKVEWVIEIIVMKTVKIDMTIEGIKKDLTIEEIQALIGPGLQEEDKWEAAWAALEEADQEQGLEEDMIKIGDHQEITQADHTIETVVTTTEEMMAIMALLR